MALPNIIMPSALGTWLLDGYAATPQAVYSSVAMSSGADRLRRVFTTAPRVESASLQLSAAQAAVFDAWFETGLQAGELAFAARVAKLDGGVEWWTARFAEPPALDALHLGRWQVQAQLLLTGEPQADAPTPSALALHCVARL